MKIKGVFLVAIFMAVLCISGNVFAVLSGAGTTSNPYLIQSRADFDEFANPANASMYWANGKYTKLMCDIDLAGRTYTQAIIASDTDPNTFGFQGTQFTGGFDGNRYVISNAVVVASTQDFVSLFGCVGPGGQIFNLGVENISVSGRYYVGGLAGWNWGTLSACFGTGSVGGISFVGGLAAGGNGIITNSYSNCSVSGYNDVGGFVGSNSSAGSLTYCYATGTVSGSLAVGGLVGRNSGGINACFWDTQTSETTDGVGNLNPDPAGVTGKTTAEMMTLITFTDAGWDFEGETANGTADIWTMPLESYPLLAGLEQYRGSLQVNIMPQGIIGDGAQWRRSGTSVWFDSGNTESNIPIGDYTLEFKEMPYWSNPNDISVTINANQLTEVNASYSYDYGGGDGTSSDPYQIWIPEQMNFIGSDPINWDKHFKLMANIDMSIYTGTEYNIIGNETIKFTGTFNGNGYVIGNFTCTSENSSWVGLFGYTENASIRNCSLENVNISGYNNVGGLVGRNNNSSLISCCVSGSVSGDSYIGGLAGSASSSSIVDCFTSGSVTGLSGAGGLVGVIGFCVLNGCYSSASVGALIAGAGGLVGNGDDSTLIRCYATGAVSGENYVGGLVGYNDSHGSLTCCYASGAVSGYKGVGGLIGYNYYATLDNCYAKGSVRGTGYNIGGLAGGSSPLINACFWDIHSSGKSDGVGNVNPDPAGAIGKTTTAMKTLATFTDAGWDFTTPVWQMPMNDYPRLALEIVPVLPTYSGGSGTETNPFLISTAMELNSLGKTALHWDKHFKLIDDIDMCEYTGTQYKIIGNLTTPFTGTFDGDGHIISNFTTTASLNYVGLFGYISYGTIKNVGLENILIESNGDRIGGLVGRNDSGSISDCYVTGLVKGTGSSGNTGGLIGENAGLITSCYASVTVTAVGSYTGGFAGINAGGTIICSYASGSVISSNYSDNIGGFIGANTGTLISCYATGMVTGTDDYIGGLAGSNIGTITACYATGSVISDYVSSYVGGLVGYNQSGNITFCYSTGSIGPHYYSTVGGLVGFGNSTQLVTACFWDIETSGQTKSSGGGTGKTTIQMQTKSTFTNSGWDFTNESVNGLHDFWQIEINDYPHLTAKTWMLEGEGTLANPYLIANTADLGMVLVRPASCYRLIVNLDLSGISWSTAIVPVFYGVFEGQGYVISNAKINQPGSHYIGLFGRIQTDSQVRNLVAENVDITGYHYVGGLAGVNAAGIIISCYTSGLVANSSSDSCIGGMVGANGGTVMSSYTNSTVTGYRVVGGLAGTNIGSIKDCYAAGSVSGKSHYLGSIVGGLVGWNNASTTSITNCYSTGLVTNASSGSGYSKGGLVGQCSNLNTIIACFWDVQTSGQTISSGGGTGLTTEEMQTLSMFVDAGWDFTNETTNGTNDIWRMCTKGVDYPRLNWEFTNGDYSCPDGVNTEDLSYYLSHWLMNNCTSGNNYCAGADLNYSGVVDLADWAIFAENWMSQ